MTRSLPHPTLRRDSSLPLNRRNPAIKVTTVGLALAGLTATSALAATKTWNGDVLWSDGSGWTPGGVPTTNDDVVAAIPNVLLLDVDSAPINSLELRSGANLATNGSLLLVESATGTGTIQLDGASTQLIVNPRQPIGSFNAVDTHELNLSGSRLAMQDGVVNVRGRLSNVSGHITGEGLIRIGGTSANSLDNVNGAITASGGTLRIQNDNAGAFDLDGSSGNETVAVLNAIDGNSSLIIDAPLNDAYDGALNLRGGNQMRFPRGLILGGNGTINIDATVGAATLTGGQFNNTGAININSGTLGLGASSVPVRLASNNGSTVNIANNAFLELRDRGDIGTSGKAQLAGGGVFGAALTNSGKITGHGRIATQDLINNGVIEATGGTLEIDTGVGIPDLDGSFDFGRLQANNGTLDLRFGGTGIVSFKDDVVLQQNGVMKSNNPFRVESGGSVLMSPGARLVADGGYIQEPGSSLTVTNDGTATIESGFFTSFNGTNTINGQLALDGTFFIDNTATFQGNGTVRVATDARLALETGAFVGVNVFNDGRLTPGILTSGAAAAANFDLLTLGNTSALEIEIGGTTPGSEHDRITADTLFLNGMLTLNVVGGFTPNAGQTFDIVSADFLTGGFDNAANGQRLFTTDGEASFVVNYGSGSAFASNRVILSDFSFLGGFSGDYNDSGQVEQGDLDLVLQNWGVNTDVAGVPAGWVSALPEGLVDQAELDGVLQNWGSVSAPNFAGSPVPEPVSAAVVFAALAITCRRHSASRLGLD